MEQRELLVDEESLIKKIQEQEERKEAKSLFSRIGWSYVIFLAFGIFAHALFLIFYSAFQSATGIEIKERAVKDFVSFLLSMIPMYGIGIPILLSLLKPLSKTPIAGETFGVARMLKIYIISIPIIYLGNIVGLGLAELIGNITGKSPTNAVSELIENSNILVNFLFVVIVGPIIEEVLFRKILIDRTIKFGERNAVILSAVMFGLFHMNLYQLFYTTALGSVFAYVYVKSGKLRYPVLLHMMINFMGGIMPVIIASPEALNALEGIQQGKMESLSSQDQMRVILFVVYFLIIFIIAILGMILFFKNIKKVKLDEGRTTLNRKVLRYLTYGNWGMIFFVSFCFVMICVSMMAQLN